METATQLEVVAALVSFVAVLVSYLFFKRRQRVRRRSEQDGPATWTGQVIDVAKLKPRVDEVRRDYLKGPLPAKTLCFQRALLDLARQVVVRLAYFHDKEPDSHEPSHRP